jgi:hypothetical protein
LRALPYQRLKDAASVSVSGLWLAHNELSHSPNLLQELLESFPGLSLLDLENNHLTCDHLRLLPSAEETERRRLERRFLEAQAADHTDGGEEESKTHTTRTSAHAQYTRHTQHLRARSEMQLSCFFCSMRVVYLDCNRLTSLPAELFTCLPNLRWVTAHRNCLTSLPSEVGRATRLEGLRLDNNQLREVPKELGQLPNLLCLSMCDNDLRSLPEEMAGLRAIETLMVRGNPNLLALPSCVARLAGTLTEFSADAIAERPDHQRLPQGTFHRAESLLNIAAGTCVVHLVVVVVAVISMLTRWRWWRWSQGAREGCSRPGASSDITYPKS